MKKICLCSLMLFSILVTRGQEFEKQLVAARTAYTSGKLEDTRFAMQQMLQELDIITGKEILKLLPLQMNAKSSNAKNDNVSGASGYFGVVIHRDYDVIPEQKIEVDLITNSPMLTSINALLSLPFGIGNTGDSKVIKINGYKALLQKHGSDTEKPNWELQLPMNSSLITMKAPGYSQDDLIKMANTIPVADIAKLLQ
jgi:hypothetical protein